MVTEMVALVRPGGVVAVQDTDHGAWFCDPPHPAWTTLRGVPHHLSGPWDRRVPWATPASIIARGRPRGRGRRSAYPGGPAGSAPPQATPGTPGSGPRHHHHPGGAYGTGPDSTA